MNDLRNDLGIGCIMDSTSEIAMTVNETVIRETQKRAGFRTVNGCGLDDDQSNLALRIANIAVDDVLVDKAIFAGEARHHRRNKRAVRNHHAVYVERLE